MSKELTQNMGQFDELLSIIDNARTRALKAVNAELIQMYWNVGEYLSSLCANSGFGDKVILMRWQRISQRPIPASKASTAADSTA